MKTSPARVLLAATIAVLALAGCTSTPAEPTTPTTGPAMSMEDAGEYYLDTVCAVNDAGAPVGVAYDAGDLPAFIAAAEVARDAYKESGLRFSAEGVVWPDAVASDIIILRDASVALATSYQSLSEVDSLEAANEVVFPNSADSADAASRIRDALGLSSDPEVSCP